MSETDSRIQSDDASTRPFRAVLTGERIQTAVRLVGALVDECHLRFDADGLRFRAIDPATVALVDLTLEPAAFDAYEAVEGEVGVDLSRLETVVKIADRGQPVQLALDPETRRLDVRIGGLSYSLALLDPETVRSPPSRADLDAEFAAAVVTETETVDRAVRAAEMVSDHLVLGTDAGEKRAEARFYVEAEGDTDDVSVELFADDLRELDAGEARSLFSVNYLKEMSRALPRGLEVDLRFGTEVPLALRCEFVEGTGTVEYLLSPRIAAN